MSKNNKASAAKSKKSAPKAKATRATNLVEKNGVRRPGPDGNTGKIWEIADDISKKTGAPAYRKDVLAAADKQGIPTATAATQYGRWRKFNGLDGRLPSRTEKTTKPAKKAAAKGKPAAPKPPRPPKVVKTAGGTATVTETPTNTSVSVEQDV